MNGMENNLEAEQPDVVADQTDADLKESMDGSEGPLGRSIGERQQDMDRAESERLAEKYFPESDPESQDERIRSGMEQFAERHENAAGASIGHEMDDPNRDIESELADWHRHDRAATDKAWESAEELGQFGKSAVEGASDLNEGNAVGAGIDFADAGEHLHSTNDARNEMLAERGQADNVRSGWAQELSSLEHERGGLENIRDVDLSDDRLREEMSDHIDGAEQMPGDELREALDGKIEEIEERERLLKEALEKTQPRI